MNKGTTHNNRGVYNRKVTVALALWTDRYAMRSQNTRFILHKLKVGLRRRCPECEQGALFKSHFAMHATCAYCQVRFARHSGDTIGGVYINVALAELTAFLGFYILHTLTGIPIIHQLLIWIPYVVIFTLAFYPLARGLWIAVTYLTGGIYADSDYTREYVAPYYYAHRNDMLSVDYDESTAGE